MKTLALLLLTVAVSLCGCTSGPAAELHEDGAVNAGPFKAARTVKIMPVVMPADIEGWKPGSAWRVDMATEGAESFAKGCNDADGDIRASVSKGDLIVTITATHVNNGDKGGHYMGGNPEASLTAVCVVTTADGRELARLNGKSRIVSYRGSAWPDLCYRLGEDFNTWFESKR